MLRMVDETFAQIQSQAPERLSFAVSFALFEYALKEVFEVAGNGKASPNWPEFERTAPDLGESAKPELQDAIDYVVNDPPMVQKARDGRAEFQPVPLSGAGNDAICESLRRIRNNLFHGGKQSYTERDKLLVEAGLEIIEGYLQNNPRVRSAFLRGAR